ncbi:peptidoglycan DD-metalloendopeptidase family protein [Chelativorans sp.]|uniref:peptidoglycan DD-metalloendopeptidase family protein n=1 Tax=Chelativorans sp. TaxID=2203393 RepID=UPI002811180B|nr:peptidoglycan DD-metalloendopeptidase family protein [Chelativorans sp.]
MKLGKRAGSFDRSGDLPVIIFARGQDVRYFTIRPWMTLFACAALASITIGYFAATAYLVLRDDLVAADMARQSHLQQAYEDRIATLRAQLDQMASRQAMEQQLMQRKVAELLRKQDELVERHSRLDPVLQRAEQLKAAGGSAPLPTPRPDVRADAQIDRTAITASAYTGLAAAKIPWPLRKGDEPSEPAARAEALFSALDRALHDLESNQLTRIGTLTEEAYQTADAISAALHDAGITLASGYGEEDVGGPLLAGGDALPFDERVRELDDALDRLEDVKQRARRIPVANPIPGAAVTSSFGMRRDPILGRPAHHSGMDFRAPPGAPVRAAGAGTVVSAGWNDGYGRMVEVDHGNGITTRYAHLSRILVRKGEEIRNGALIGRVGSSGRSTGPHLHYEVRKNGRAVNPLKFLSVGRRIAALL